MRPTQKWLAVLATLAVLVGIVPAASAGSEPTNQTIALQLLAVNDLHGQITTGKTVAGQPVGGAAYLAGYIERETQENPDNTLLLSIGDAVGASPPVSALLQDEPTIRFMNAMHFDLGVLGNHEFDEGIPEMFRLLNGGCSPITEPVTGCFGGADFPVLAANVVWNDTDQPILPPYKIYKYKNVRVGFIGVVTDTTPGIVIKGATDGVTFLDEATTINRYARELQAQGVQAIVAMVHEGGFVDSSTDQLTGDIVDIASNVDDSVDVILSGHTHQGYAQMVDGKLVVQAYSYSTALADVDLTLDRRSGDVVAKEAEIITTWDNDIQPDPQIAAMVAHDEELVGPIINEVIGTAADDITRTQNAAGESALGNLIADSQRWKMDTDFAFMNPGGIRSDLSAGDVTWGELFSVQPFGNTLVTMDLTGEQIYALLTQQFASNRFLQISGLEYDRTGSSIVQVRQVLNDGTTQVVPNDSSQTYSVTVNSFLAGGGDGFTVLEQGTNRVNGPVDLDAIVDYIQQLPQPFDATIEGRINLMP